MYNVLIQHPEWEHSVCDYPTKSEALKRASYLRRYGCSWSDSESRSTLEECSVMVYDESNSSYIYVQPFTQKYLSFRKAS